MANRSACSVGIMRNAMLSRLEEIGKLPNSFWLPIDGHSADNVSCRSKWKAEMAMNYRLIYVAKGPNHSWTLLTT